MPSSIGVFQGSALGPLLYTVFANALDAHVIQYADDTQILVSGSKDSISALVSRMDSSLTSLDVWCRANSLKINASKTQLMVFGSRQNLRSVPAIEVRFRVDTLRPKRVTRNLGGLFDSTLSWDAIATFLIGDLRSQVMLISWHVHY